jgi:hypothetical protein
MTLDGEQLREWPRENGADVNIAQADLVGPMKLPPRVPAAAACGVFCANRARLARAILSPQHKGENEGSKEEESNGGADGE